jgi:hypothetical protein
VVVEGDRPALGAQLPGAADVEGVLVELEEHAEGGTHLAARTRALELEPDALGVGRLAGFGQPPAAEGAGAEGHQPSNGQRQRLVLGVDGRGPRHRGAQTLGGRRPHAAQGVQHDQVGRAGVWGGHWRPASA